VCRSWVGVMCARAGGASGDAARGTAAGAQLVDRPSVTFPHGQGGRETC
jgi:hypothetical protein